MPEYFFATDTSKGVFFWRVKAETLPVAETSLRAVLLFFPDIEFISLEPCEPVDVMLDNVNIIDEFANPLCGIDWWAACDRLDEFKQKVKMKLQGKGASLNEQAGPRE